MIRDLAIVGAGPAGISAALWARSLDLDAVVLERADRAGGQLHLIHFRLRNVAGATGLTGAELAGRLAASDPPLDLRHRAEVMGLEPDPLALRLGDGGRVETRAVLVASGARRRPLEATGAARLEGRGVSYSATADRERFAGRDMVVVGGGDAAYENALILADAGCRVTLVARGRSRARPEFRARVAARRTVVVREHAEIVEVLGEDLVRGVRLRLGDGSEERLACEGVVVKIGMVPNSEPFRDILDVDPQGYLRVDAALRTSHPRVWAAGDIARPSLFGIPVAWGHGALAVEAIRKTLKG